MIKDENFILNNGVKIPKIGLGTWQSKNGDEAYNSVKWALEYGYRHIDTAYDYQNEVSVGKAIKDSKLERSEVFITTKCPSHVKDYAGAIEHFNSSIKSLDTDYLDLYLIHAPWPWSNVGQDCTEGNIEVWKAMIKLYNEGRIRSIGVSNFSISDIEALIKSTGFKPHANQIRYFIGNTQEELTKYCQENDILIEAYSPFATGELIDNPIINEMAEKYNTTIPKICLRFCVQNNTLPLPKSVHQNRIIDNLDFDFVISKEDMDYLNSLHHIASTRELRD